MKKIILSLLFFLLSLDANNSFINLKRLNKAPLEVVLKQLAKELSRDLPKNIDGFMTLAKVNHLKRINYIFKNIDIERANEIKDALKNEKSKAYLKKLFFLNDKEEICNEKTLKYILSRGAVLKFEWLDKKNNLLFSYNIDNRDCSYP